MSHNDAGQYKAKHLAKIHADPEIAQIISEYSNDGCISCTAAHQIAEERNLSPEKIGQLIDLLEIKLNRCQLGLFGYQESERNIVPPAEVVSIEMENRIISEMNDNRISCRSLWNIASDVKLSKMAMTAACEALGIKISRCQLGTF